MYRVHFLDRHSDSRRGGEWRCRFHSRLGMSRRSFSIGLSQIKTDKVEMEGVGVVLKESRP